VKQGQDVIIDSNTKFTRPELVELGNHIGIDWGFYCTTQLTVGDYVHISPHVAVIGGAKAGLTVEDFCFISVGARLVCASEEFYGEGLIGPIIPDEYKDNQIVRPIILRRFSGVCANSVVLPGVEMAEGSILGANSLLKESTEPWTIYAGSPAKPIKKRRQDKMYDYARKLGYDY
jgi:acetyltransferase-like isoleucine patch superfamily enzyme